jgi:hypothetical protein
MTPITRMASQMRSVLCRLTHRSAPSGTHSNDAYRRHIERPTAPPQSVHPNPLDASVHSRAHSQPNPEVPGLWPGAAPDLIARAMRHADTRMVERCYGRLPVNDLERRLAAAIGQLDCSAGATDSANIAGFTGPSAHDADTRNAKTPQEAGSIVPRDRIELPTRGFSILCSTN